MATLAQKMSSTILAIRNCEKHGNSEWLDTHTSTLSSLVQHLPSGAGFDAGTEIAVDECTDRLLMFHTSYHHMNDVGFYTHWTEHTVRVYATFDGLGITVAGRDSGGIKDHIADEFHSVLNTEIHEQEVG